MPIKILSLAVLACLFSACIEPGSDGPPADPGRQCFQHAERPCVLSLGSPTDQPLRFRVDSSGIQSRFMGERVYTRIRDTSGGAIFEVRDDGFIRSIAGEEPDSEYHRSSTLFVDSMSFHSLPGLMACTDRSHPSSWGMGKIPLLLSGCVEGTFLTDSTWLQTDRSEFLNIAIRAEGDSIVYNRTVRGLRTESNMTTVFSSRGGIDRFESHMDGIVTPSGSIQLTRVRDDP